MPEACLAIIKICLLECRFDKLVRDIIYHFLQVIFFPLLKKLSDSFTSKVLGHSP